MNEQHPLKAIPKAADSAADKISEMLDRFNKRLTLSNPRFVERYVNSELHIFLEFSIREIRQKFVAHFQWAHDSASGFEVCDDWSKFNWDSSQFKEPFLRHLMYSSGDIKAPVVGCRGEQNTMLVENMEAIENPQLVPLSSLISVDTAESFYRILPQYLFYSSHCGFVFRGGIANGEIKFPVEIDSGCNLQLAGQMIQGTSKVIKRVPGNCADVDGNRIDFGHVIDRSSCLRVALGSNFIWPSIAEDADGSIEIHDVLFGPFNFNHGQSQSFGGSHIVTAPKDQAEPNGRSRPSPRFGVTGS